MMLIYIRDSYGTQVYSFSLRCWFLYDVISCDLIIVKNFREVFEVLLLNSGYAPASIYEHSELKRFQKYNFFL